MCFVPWRWVCQILTIIKSAVGLRLLVALCVLSHRFSLFSTIHLLCSRWDHRQSCCWSIRSESTWCLLARIPPETVTKILFQKWDWKYLNKEKKREGRGHLLCLQGELNENLLQFLVHKVDAELFKSIFLKKKVRGLNVTLIQGKLPV